MLGREQEWARIERYLAALPQGGVVIALEGAPGIGKTTLWQEAVAEARRQGCVVRATAPSEPDANLAFAGLGDLLDRLPANVVARLPAPQRRALSLALVMDADTGSPPDQRALLRAVLNILRAVAAQAPLLVAIDAEHWLDAPTARVLTFALPRLRDAPIGVVMTRRPATDGAVWGQLAADAGGEGVLRQTIDPLDRVAIDALLMSRLGRRLPRPLVDRIHAGSGGNPLYALAIARELERRSDRGGDLPIPRTLAEAISAPERRG